MSVEKNKLLVRKFINEVVNKRNFDLLDEVCAEDTVWHVGSMGEVRGIKEFRRLNTEAGGAIIFPDFQIMIDDLIAERDEVAVRYTVNATHIGTFMGVAPTGKKVKWEASVIYFIRENKIAEIWVYEDMLGLMKQIGVKEIPQSTGE